MTDINTVFYFADNLSLYEANQGKLSSYTISFVPQGNGVGYIYKNNVKYGGVSADELIDIIENTPGIIPFASTSKAGIIKLGDGLVAADDSGTVRVNFDSVLERIPNAIQLYFDRNPISGGSVVTYDAKQTDGTELGTISINGTATKIFAPTQKDYSLSSAGLNNNLLTIRQANGSYVQADLSSLAGQGLPTQLINYSITGARLQDQELWIEQDHANVTKRVDLSSIAGGSEYTLLPASSSTLGGIKIGFTANGKKYPVELDELTQKAYVEVPWQPSTTVVEGYIVDLVNGTMVVVTDKQGNTGNYSNTAQIHVYNNGVEYDDFTVTIGDPTLSDGSAIPAGKVSATYENHNVTVTLNNLSEFSAKTLSIPLTVTLGNGSVRPLVITCVGVSIGADGEPGSSINLKTSAAAIRTDYYKNNAYPTSIDVWASITSGSSNIQTVNIVPGSEDAERIGFSFKYHYNGGNDVDLTSGTISNIDPSKDGLVVELYYNNIRIDSEEIPYVRDGADGIGVSAVNYRINVLSSNVIVSDGTDGKVVNGSVKFNVTRQVGADTDTLSYIDRTSATFDDATISLTCMMDNQSMLSDANTTADSNHTWTVSLTNKAYENFPYAAIYVRSATTTILASAVVPFIIKGEKGESSGGGQVQPLQGVVMRMVNWQEGTTYYGGIIPDSTGVKYMDVVLYTDGYYYRPVVELTNEAPVVLNDETGEYVTNSKWSMFFPSDSAAFQALIANFAFIKNLTAKEVIITNDDNQPEAGITSGKEVTTEGELLNGVHKGSIRFWAGNYLENGVNDLMYCPFYVTNAGYLHATDVALSGNVTINTNNGDVVIDGNGVTILKTVTTNGQSKVVDGVKISGDGVLRWDGNRWVPFYAGRKIKHLSFPITDSNHVGGQYEYYINGETDDFIAFDIPGSHYSVDDEGQVDFYLPSVMGDYLGGGLYEGKIFTIRSIVGNANIHALSSNRVITGGNPSNPNEFSFSSAPLRNGNRIELVLIKYNGEWAWLLNSFGTAQ